MTSNIINKIIVIYIKKSKNWHQKTKITQYTVRQQQKNIYQIVKQKLEIWKDYITQLYEDERRQSKFENI